MPNPTDPTQSTRDVLTALPGVRKRRMFGTEAFFAGPVLFAFLGDEGVVLRLPDAEHSAALANGNARAFLGALPEGLSGWAVAPDAPSSLPLIRAAHQLARGLARSAVRRTGRTGRAGRTRRAGQKGKE